MEILYLNLDKENNGLPLFSPTPDPNAEYGFYRQEWIRKLANPIISPMKKKAFDGDDFCGVMSMAKAGKFHKLTPSVDEYLCVYALSRRLSLAKNTKELSDILIYKMGFNLTCTLNGIRENFYMREFSQEFVNMEVLVDIDTGKITGIFRYHNGKDEEIRVPLDIFGFEYLVWNTYADYTNKNNAFFIRETQLNSTQYSIFQKITTLDEYYPEIDSVDIHNFPSFEEIENGAKFLDISKTPSNTHKKDTSNWDIHTLPNIGKNVITHRMKLDKENKEFREMLRKAVENINFEKIMKQDIKETENLSKIQSQNISKTQPQSNHDDFIGCVTQTIFLIVISIFLIWLGSR